jgi:hypothetical protein
LKVGVDLARLERAEKVVEAARRVYPMHDTIYCKTLACAACVLAGALAAYDGAGGGE